MKIFFSCWIAIASMFSLFILIHQGRIDSHLGMTIAALFAVAFTVSFRLFLRFRAREKWVLKSLSAAVVSYLALLLLIYFAQTHLLFAPVPGNFANCPQLTQNGFTKVEIQSEGQDIRAFVRNQPAAKATMLIYHGNAESACKDDKYTLNLGEIPMNLVFAEYPGYKNDSGSLSESAYLKNAMAIRHWTGERFSGSPIILMGRSLGTSIATYVASEAPCVGLILISPFTSIEELAPHAFPIFPKALITVDKFRAWQWAEKVQVPTLILHGTADRLIPIEMGQRESTHFQNLAAFTPIAGATHNGIAARESAIWPMIQNYINGQLATNH